MKPTGKITFLFTDIEGSTKLAQDFTETLPAALEIHHSILTKAIESNNGFVFEIIGDAFCCSFEKAEDAVKAAVDVQIFLAEEKWESAEIKVRIGIHTGEAEWDGNRYMGYITLARTARVMSSAYGEQIIISKDTYDLVFDKFEAVKEKNISFRDLGERRLKDVIQPIRLFQIVSDRLREDFPPLKTLDARPNNLPVQLTSFIGRKNEIMLVKEFLSQTHLLTITGPGGSGKSRLALQVAADVIDEFSNGVWFVELAAITEPDFLVQEIMDVFELKEESNKRPEDILKDYLKNKEILIILDNCEHLIETCAVLAEKLLSDSPKLKIIATSREALRCNGEQTHIIKSLEVPDPKHEISPDKLTQYESVRLFVERALAVDSTFRISKENAADIMKICHQLDGIPLALELAAARTKVLSVEMIRERLNDRLNLLTSGKRTAMPRQKTLRALTDWSHDLLTMEEKIMWRRLSVFTGGWTLEAAEEVCMDEKLKKETILELMDQLVEKSIILFKNEKERYTILETIKQYGEEKLIEAGEKERFFTKHVQYFSALTESIEPKLTGREANYWLERLESDHCNLESAIYRSVSGGVPEKGALLAGSLGTFWDIRGHYSTGKKLLDILPASEFSRFLLGKILLCKGLLTMKTGQYEKARKFYNESLEIFREEGDDCEIAQSLYRLGQIDLEKGNYKSAQVYFDESLETGCKNNHYPIIANSLRGLGNVFFNTGEYDKALKFYRECLETNRTSGDKRGLALSLYGLGQLVLFQGKHEQALSYYKECNELLIETGDKRGITLSLYGLGLVSFNLKNYEQAQNYFEECLKLSRDTGLKMSIARSLFGLGDVARVKNKLDQARNYYKEGYELALEMGDKIGIAYSLLELGNVDKEEGNYDQAQRYFEEGLIVYKETENKAGMIESLLRIIWILTESEQLVKSAKLLYAVKSELIFMGRDFGKREKELQSKIINKLKENVSEEEFDKYCEEGKKMTLEEAVRLAVSSC